MEMTRISVREISILLDLRLPAQNEIIEGSWFSDTTENEFLLMRYQKDTL